MASSLRTLRVSPLLSRARPSPALSPLAHPTRFSSHDHHAAPSPHDDVFPEEGKHPSLPSPSSLSQLNPSSSPANAGFGKPIWRNLTITTLAIALVYRLYPSDTPTSESTIAAATAWIKENLTPAQGKWAANQARHLDLAKQLADDTLLYQEAERPKVQRLRFPG